MCLAPGEAASGGLMVGAHPLSCLLVVLARSRSRRTARAMSSPGGVGEFGRRGLPHRRPLPAGHRLARLRVDASPSSMRLQVGGVYQTRRHLEAREPMADAGVFAGEGDPVDRAREHARVKPWREPSAASVSEPGPRKSMRLQVGGVYQTRRHLEAREPMADAGVFAGEGDPVDRAREHARVKPWREPSAASVSEPGPRKRERYWQRDPVPSHSCVEQTLEGRRRHGTTNERRADVRAGVVWPGVARRGERRGSRGG